jgi:hypothetical protein
MKSLGIAIGIVLAVSAVLFGIVHAFGVGDKVAGPLAGSTLGFITFVHDKVEKALSSGRSRVNPGIVPFAGFDIRWPYMLVYATLSFVAILEFSNIVSMTPLLIFQSTENLSSQVMLGIVAVLSIPMVCTGIFLLGRWAGMRSAKAGYWIIPVALVLGRALDFLVIYFFVPSARSMFLGALREAANFAGSMVLLLLLIAIGILGVWRGNRSRFGAYFNSLLKQVSQPTRDALLAMTFEEAKTSASSLLI